MFFVLLSVLFTVVIFLLLKAIEKFQLKIFQTILINYLVAAIVGFLLMSPVTLLKSSQYNLWWWFAGLIALIFVITFNLMAKTAQLGGLAMMTVANKMSVVIPILFGVFFYYEKLNYLKEIGILVALLGVFFTVYKKREEGVVDNRLIYLPILIFLGSGLADVLMNHVQMFILPNRFLGMFTTMLFLGCFVISLLYFIGQLILKKDTICLKSWIGGVVLGIPNYFSIYFLLKALSQKNIETSLVFAVNNLLIVFLSAIVGMLFYKEKLSRINFLGLILSVLAITLFYFSFLHGS